MAAWRARELRCLEAIRYGLISSPGRPNSTTAAKPTRVAESVLVNEDGSGRIMNCQRMVRPTKERADKARPARSQRWSMRAKVWRNLSQSNVL